jgi:predicted Zn-dependent peptidase
LKQRIDGIKAAKDRAQGVIGEYFNAYLYGSHPYGKPVGGHETSLAAIKPENVTAFYQQNYAPTSVILAAVGDFATTEMESMLGEAFGAWKGKPAPQVQLNDPPTIARNRLLLVDKPDSTQTFFRIGSIGISATNPDRFYIEVVNTLFGGRFTSMLNTELRIKSGLTYGANSFFDRRRLPGPFAMASYTKNASTEQALDLTLDVLKRLREKGITEEELASAKAFIQGQFPPEIETSDQLGELLTRLKYFGLGASEVDDYFSKINAMTLADAQRIIKQYFPLDNLVFVLIGKDSEIRNIAKKYAGQLDSKSITHAGF